MPTLHINTIPENTDYGGKYCLYRAVVRQCYPTLYYFKCNGDRNNITSQNDDVRYRL